MSKPTPYEMNFAHRAWWQAKEAGKPVPQLDHALEKCRKTRTNASRFEENSQHPDMPQTSPVRFETQQSHSLRVVVWRQSRRAERWGMIYRTILYSAAGLVALGLGLWLASHAPKAAGLMRSSGSMVSR